MGDGGQNLAGGQTAQEGECVTVPDHGGRQGNARNNLANRSGLAKTLGDLAKQQRGDQQNEEFGKNVHRRFWITSRFLEATNQ